MAFSALCQKAFPSLQPTSFKGLCKPKANVVSIQGGSIQHHREVLERMLSCYEGRGTGSFKFVALTGLLTDSHLLRRTSCAPDEISWNRGMASLH